MVQVKEWTYEEFPEFTDQVEGAAVLPTTGDEVGVTYLKDIEYAKLDGVSLRLQILVPTKRNDFKEKYPCVVFVQGSAWMKQNVYCQLPNVSALAKRGYVVAIVEYRHSELAAFPAQIMDARNAVRFLKKNADEYRINARHMFIAGDSSGGHTAMYAGMCQDDRVDNLYPGISASVNGIINYYGSTSVMAEDSNPTQLLHCQPDSPEGMVMGHVDLRDHPELKQKLSVECNITSDTIIPPTLLFHGTKDRTVNCECSVTLYKKMRECGKEVSLYLLQGADHGGSEFWTEQVIDIVDTFIQRWLD